MRLALLVLMSSLITLPAVADPSGAHRRVYLEATDHGALQELSVWAVELLPRWVEVEFRAVTRSTDTPVRVEVRFNGARESWRVVQLLEVGPGDHRGVVGVPAGGWTYFCARVFDASGAVIATLGSPSDSPRRARLDDASPPRIVRPSTPMDPHLRFDYRPDPTMLTERRGVRHAQALVHEEEGLWTVEFAIELSETSPSDMVVARWSTRRGGFIVTRLEPTGDGLFSGQAPLLSAGLTDLQFVARRGGRVGLPGTALGARPSRCGPWSPR